MAKPSKRARERARRNAERQSSTDGLGAHERAKPSGAESDGREILGTEGIGPTHYAPLARGAENTKVGPICTTNLDPSNAEQSTTTASKESNTIEEEESEEVLSFDLAEEDRQCPMEEVSQKTQ
eukprot:9592444-Karenia_brevis.AAC.1